MDAKVRPHLMNLTFDPVSMDEAVSRCIEWCDGPRRSRVVVTANAAVLCMMRKDQELDASCRRGDLVVADGMSVVWALKASGIPVPERVTGVDLMANLLAAAARKSLRVYFLGARPEVVRDLVRLCEKQHPGLVVAGFRDGYFPRAESAKVAQEIREARPDMLFVGMPSPFKETWCERYRDVLDVPIILGVGGSFDVHAGYVRRAPVFFQKLGMEWFWRLMMEPRKMWKRYLTTNSEFLWVAGREIFSMRLGLQRRAREARIAAAPPVGRLEGPGTQEVGPARAANDR